MVTSHLRFAAGVCLLSTGLLIGGAGGAIAVADPDSSGTTLHDHDSANESSQGSSPAGSAASNPAGSVSDTLRETLQGTVRKTVQGTLRKTVQGVKSTLGSGRKSGQQHSTVTEGPKIEPGGTVPNDARKDSGLVGAVPSLVAPFPNVVASFPNVVASFPNVVAPFPNVVGSVTNVLAPVTNVVAAVPGLVAPVSDVITSVQDMLTSVAGAVIPLTQLPSDLSSLFGIAGVEPVVDARGGIDGAGQSAAAGASVLATPLGASQLPLFRIPGVPLAGNANGVATLGGIGATTHVGRESSLPGMAPLAPNGATTMGARSFFRQFVSEVLIPASLSALAAVALPGVGGLVIFTAAGVRVGYRQAKAGLAIPTAGIARFAGPGPLGVVHSGSLVVVRPRALRVVRPRALRVVRPQAPGAGCLLDNVA